MPTTAYQAGDEANAVEISYGLEATWGVAPATTFQAIRATGESLSAKKQRSRPNELNPSAQASAEVTQQVTADGAINAAFSYATYDGLLVSLLNSAWSDPVTITGVSGDIAFVASGNKITSTTNGKFADVVEGMWLKIIGSAPNLGYVRVANKVDDEELDVDGMTLTNDTPSGANAVLKSSGMIRNSNVFQSLFMQKKFASARWLRYPGTQVVGLTRNAQQGQFVEGSFNLISKTELKGTADASTGGVVAAPTGRVLDTVAQFQQLQLDGAVIAAACKGVTLQMTKEGASNDYAIGSSAAQGTRMGKLTVSGGKATFYFKDFTLYDLYIAESQHRLSWRETDLLGNSTIFTLPKITLINPTIVAGGPNQPVMADFTLSADPDDAYGTIQIDRIAA